MPDEKTERAPEDGRRINLSERYDVMYWTDRFGVSESQLEAAVMAVGSGANAVENYLINEKK